MAAKGSWNSPIYVSDGEEEHDVAGQLIYHNSAPPPQNTSSQRYPQMDTGSEPRSNPQKRKRDEAFNNNNYQNRNNFMGSSTAYTETKKARKRRRRMEREEALMAQSRAAQAMMPSFSVIPFLPALNLNNSWPGPAPPFNHPFSLGMPLPFPPQNHSNNPQNNNFYPPLPPAEYPTYNNPPLRYDGHGNGNGHGNGYTGNGHQDRPSSSWVSSMTANQNHHQQNPDLDFWDQYAAPPLPVATPPPPPAPLSYHVPTPTLAPPPPPMRTPIPVDPIPIPSEPPRTRTPPPPPAAPALPPPPPPPVTAKTPVAAKKPASLIIGMNPDQDRHSKHGTFHHSVHTVTSLSNFSINPKDKSDTNDKAADENYIPNPARTLVMEQLPKTHRSREFIRAWAKGASGGALPVYFAVDPPSGKALVEFATAEVARRAWGSPKLGIGVNGAGKDKDKNTKDGGKKPLKGRPRADLIRVWWYRVDGVGAGAGVGEIEEGEIEGDVGDAVDATVPTAGTSAEAGGSGGGEDGKKESKKERKARLAREREAKAATAKTKMQAVIASTSALGDTTVQEREDAAAPTPTPDSPPPAYQVVASTSGSSAYPTAYPDPYTHFQPSASWSTATAGSDTLSTSTSASSTPLHDQGHAPNVNSNIPRKGTRIMATPKRGREWRGPPSASDRPVPVAPPSTAPTPTSTSTFEYHSYPRSTPGVIQTATRSVSGRAPLLPQAMLVGEWGAAEGASSGSASAEGVQALSGQELQQSFGGAGAGASGGGSASQWGDWAPILAPPPPPPPLVTFPYAPPPSSASQQPHSNTQSGDVEMGSGVDAPSRSGKGPRRMSGGERRRRLAKAGLLEVDIAVDVDVPEEVDVDMELDTPASADAGRNGEPWAAPGLGSVQSSPEMEFAPGLGMTSASSAYADDSYFEASFAPGLGLARSSPTPTPAAAATNSKQQEKEKSQQKQKQKHSGTPPLEPRAMKNVPKGPSFVKRTLGLVSTTAVGAGAGSSGENGVAGGSGSASASARQRELDLGERVRRGRSLREAETASASASASGVALNAGDAEAGGAEEDPASMEDNLRRLVLKSQRSKKVRTVPAPVPVSEVAAEVDADVEMPSASTGTATPSGGAGAGFSLDDLAVSFITETIQTLTSAPPTPSVGDGGSAYPAPGFITSASASAPASTSAPVPASATATRTAPTAGTTNTSTASTTGSSTPTPTPTPAVSANTTPTASTTKALLAAKQARLEAHIAESRALMAQLAGAKSKVERERVLGVMRERGRLMEEESAASTTSTSAPTSTAHSSASAPNSTSHSTSASTPGTTTRIVTTTTTSNSASEKPRSPVEQLWGGGGAQQKRMRWPESRNDVCVLIISDDEDEGSDEEGESD